MNCFFSRKQSVLLLDLYVFVRCFWKTSDSRRTIISAAGRCLGHFLVMKHHHVSKGHFFQAPLYANPREQVPRTWTWKSSNTMKRWIPWSSNAPLVPKTWSIPSMVSCRSNHLRHAIPRLTRSSMCIHCSKPSRISKAGRFLRQIKSGLFVTTFPAGNGHPKWWWS